MTSGPLNHNPTTDTSVSMVNSSTAQSLPAHLRQESHQLLNFGEIYSRPQSLVAGAFLGKDGEHICAILAITGISSIHKKLLTVP